MLNETFQRADHSSAAKLLRAILNAEHKPSADDLVPLIVWKMR